MGAMAEQDVVSEIGSPRIGLEDVEDLLADVEQALQACC